MRSDAHSLSSSYVLQRGIGRRPWCAQLLLALLGLACAVASLAEPEQAPVSAVDSVAITVGDLNRSVDFYSRVLTFKKVADRELSGEDCERLFGLPGLHLHAVRMRLGDEYIELMQFQAPRGRPIDPDSRSNDRWFQHVAIVVRDMGAAYARLRDFHVEPVSSAPQRLPDWNRSAAGIEAFYFRDPDEHNLEVLKFPSGKGLPKWHTGSDAIFLGIDHTAIVVADTKASLRFYRDTLGLRIVGTSENYGPEQEHLNAVPGAHLRITSLRAAQGPGVELLEYLMPRTGRAMPTDTRATDLWYWLIELRARHPAAVALALEAAQSGSISARAPAVHDPTWRNAVIARDPDGHANLIATQAAPPGALAQ
jgi:catechol 2,3-dioxygenase-like lactoylglutathione lyase family enzyme